MATYKEGYATVIVGGQKVTGDTSEWTTYVSPGYLFKVNGDPNFYSIAAVNSATRLTLSARYADTDNETSVTNEHVATSNVGTTIYSGYLNYTPAIQNGVTINASYEVYTDDGAGNLTGTPTGSGNVDYDSGAWSISMSASYNASLNITASYLYGNTLNSLSYQIVTDYTPNYSLPELSTTDLNFQHLYTKAMRMLDSTIYNASVNAVTASAGMDITATNQGLTLTSSDGSRYKITVSNTGTLVTTSV